MGSRKKEKIFESVKEINRELFGRDAGRMYLLDDFATAVERLILYKIALHICGIAWDSFDPHQVISGTKTKTLIRKDPLGFKYSNIIRGSISDAMMLSFRILFSETEPSAGALINSVCRLTEADFSEYHNCIFPGPYARQINISPRDIQKLKDDSKKVQEYMFTKDPSNNKQYIGEYKILKEYEGLKFHKDNYPKKYNVRRWRSSDEFSLITYTSRTDCVQINIEKLCNMLEKFATFCLQYETVGLVGSDGISQRGSGVVNHGDIEMLMRQLYGQFGVSVLDSDISEQIDIVKKVLPDSLKLLYWAE